MKQLNYTTNAVIYARFSSSNQREESITGQVRDCTAYAKSKGYNIIKIYTDEAKSATTDKRPSFQEMVRDSESHSFSIVLVWKSDRFARNRFDSAFYKNLLRNNGVQVVSCMEPIPDSPEGIILEGIMEAYAEYYSANLAVAVKRGNRESALQLKTLGVEIYGYKRSEDDHYIIDSEKAPIVRRMFTEYVAGKSAKDIAECLNNEGYRTNTGKRWNANTVVRYLKNEKYTGTYIFAEYRQENAFPAIIDRDTFDQVQAKIKQHKRAPRSKVACYMLGSKMYCGLCGSPMVGEYGRSKTGREYYYYVCAGHKLQSGCDKKRIQKDLIENVIVNYLYDLLSNQDVRDKLIDAVLQLQEKESSHNDELNAATRMLTDTTKKRDNLLKSLEMGIISTAVSERINELEKQISEINENITNIRLNMPMPLTRDEINHFLDKFRSGNIEAQEFRMSLIDNCLNSAYLFDDYVIINTSLVSDTKKIELSEALDALNSSNSMQMADQISRNSNYTILSKNWAIVCKVPLSIKRAVI